MSVARRYIPLLMMAVGSHAGRLSAQSLAGVVRDSISGSPVAGAVVTLLDSANTVVRRTLSNERGEYRFDATRGARRVQAIHIGFHPATVPSVSEGSKDILMVRLPTLLVPVHVIDQPKCPRRDDQLAARALWEQTQAALLATIVAREANRATQLRLLFTREMDGNSDRIRHQSVRVDSADRVAASFAAVLTAKQFVEHGFAATGRDGATTFYAPDAAILLDDAFAGAYCFRIVPPDRSRRAQLGLGFEPAQPRTGRLDISGTVWIDTAARRLRELEFTYLEADRRVQSFKPGGHLEFREMANGSVLIDRWRLRLVAARVDSVLTAVPTAGGSVMYGAEARATPRMTFYAQETGGELARAVWPASPAWEGSLGTLAGRVRATRGTSPVGATIRLDDTGYETTVRADSTFEISHLLPGPYDIRVRDPQLADLELTLPTRVEFSADRDVTARVSFDLPTLATYTADQCHAFGREDSETRTFVLGRIEDAFGDPLKDMSWTAYVAAQSEVVLEHMDAIRAGVTGTDGFAPVCHRRVERGRPVRFVVMQRDHVVADTTLIPASDASVVRVRVHP